MARDAAGVISLVSCRDNISNSVGPPSPEQVNCSVRAPSAKQPYSGGPVQRPARYLELLAVAEKSRQGKIVVRAILDRASTQAYADLHEPLGPGRAAAWLRALVQPYTWRTHP